MATAAPAADYQQVESRFFHRVFMAFGILALLSLLISLAGKEIGSRISLGGHTDDASLHEIVIGNDVVEVPANSIRYPEQRRDGIANRVDLYLLWPKMEGFSDTNRVDFNATESNKKLVFVTFEQRTMSRDMSGRLDPIYKKMNLGSAETLPNGLTRYGLPESAGFVDEYLLVGPANRNGTFVARCLDESKSGQSLASCDRDIHVGDDLVMMARFPTALLSDWKTLDLQLSAYAHSVVKTAASQNLN